MPEPVLLVARMPFSVAPLAGEALGSPVADVAAAALAPVPVAETETETSRNAANNFVMLIFTCQLFDPTWARLARIPLATPNYLNSTLW